MRLRCARPAGLAPSLLHQRGAGPLNNEITPVEYYATRLARAESPVKEGILWAGTDDGLLHLSTDAGQHWANVTPNMPEWSTISIIDASPADANTAYVAVD